MTKAEFDEDGWFKTGDIAMYDSDKAAYRILGRSSGAVTPSTALVLPQYHPGTTLVLLPHPRAVLRCCYTPWALDSPARFSLFLAGIAHLQLLASGTAVVHSGPL